MDPSALRELGLQTSLGHSVDRPTRDEGDDGRRRLARISKGREYGGCSFFNVQYEDLLGIFDILHS